MQLILESLSCYLTGILLNRLNVYFYQMTVLEHIQSPSYNGFDILSSIGGALGLWAGLSLITVVEMFSLFCSIVSAIIKKIN